MTWSFAVFFVVMLTLLGLTNYYVYRWANRAFPLSPWMKKGLTVLLAGSLVSMALGRALTRLSDAAPARAFAFVGSIIQLGVLITLAFLLVVELASFVASTVARYRARKAPKPREVAATTSEGSDELIPRRTVLAQAAVGSAFLIGGSSALYGSLVGRHDYAIEDVPLRIPGLSKALDGFTIVQLSDIHVGTFVGDPELFAGLELVRKARPDLVVLTGDLIDHDPRFAHNLGEFARKLGPLAREGVVAITGNHDYYAGVEDTVGALMAAGAQVLRNEGRVIGGAHGFALLGVDDVWGHRYEPGGGPDLARAVRTLPLVDGKHIGRDLPRVLLCHNPSYFEESAGHVALQLSGHTHGGQVNLVVRPAEVFLKNGWVSGVYERNGSRLYVNRGFGTAGPPARIGSPPEVTRIVLTA